MIRTSVIVSGIGLLVACGVEHTSPPPPPPRDARVAQARADAGVEAPSRGYIGVITASESVDIAPRFQGVVADVKVRVGDEVTSGEVIAEMDQKSMQEELRAAESALSSARASYHAAEVDVADAKRKVALEADAVKNGIEPRANLEEAKMGLERARAAAQKAASNVATEASHAQTAKDHVHDTALRAPSDGTVLLRFKDPGATVAAGTAIVRVVGHGGLRLRFAVPPDRARSLAPKARVEATIDTVTAPVAGVIRQVSPALDPASGMIIVEAELAPDAATAPQLRPGLAAWVR